MRLPSSRFLDPATLSGIKDLRLVARTVVEGFLSGLHADPRPASGVEFNQYRTYEQGDDFRRVDWRAYARSDRILVRESQVERDVTVRFLMDASASMAHSDGTLSKFDYARLLVAGLSYLVDSQGDRIAFHAARDGETLDLPTGNRSRTLPHLLHLLEELQPSGRWPAWDLLAGRMARVRTREMVVVVTDLYEKGEEIRRALTTLRALRHEVMVLHLVARDEIEFSFEGDLIFEDLETGESVRGNAATMRQAYLDRFEETLSRWRLHFFEAGISHDLIVIDEPLDRALRSFLLRRRRLP
jgi:uncharacterized protein (DUF58 family)